MIKRVLDANKMTIAGISKWKNYDVEYIIGKMKEIFDRQTVKSDYRPVWEKLKR